MALQDFVTLRDGHIFWIDFGSTDSIATLQLICEEMPEIARLLIEDFPSPPPLVGGDTLGFHMESGDACCRALGLSPLAFSQTFFWQRPGDGRLAPTSESTESFEARRSAALVPEI